MNEKIDQRNKDYQIQKYNEMLDYFMSQGYSRYHALNIIVISSKHLVKVRG